MRNVGITIGRDRLIERTWGYDYLGDSNRVEVYVARLRKKIERNPSQPEYLITIRGIGYVFRVPARVSDPYLPAANGASDADIGVRRLLEDALSGN
jgi:DNA-binding winged helix-turn-helix (wHTH) protein